MITVVKGHGHYFSGYPGNTGVQPISRKNATIEQIMETNGKAIIIIRNPYHVLSGYRHQLLSPGHLEQAKASAFVGKGISQQLKFFVRNPCHNNFDGLYCVNMIFYRME